MLEVLAWMVVPAAAAESPLRVEPRESETSASAVFVRVSSVLMLSSPAQAESNRRNRCDCRGRLPEKDAETF